MKKLLCLLLAVLTACSFAACESEEYVEEYTESSTVTETITTASSTYGDAIRLMMKTFDNSFTKEDLGNMYPDACWTYFEETTGQTLDQIYESFSEKMEIKWAQTQEQVGEGASVRYEILERTDYIGDDYDKLTAKLTELYGFSEDAFGLCYEVKVKKATMGKLLEDIYTQNYHVLEIDGEWYVAEVLTDMLKF